MTQNATTGTNRRVRRRRYRYAMYGCLAVGIVGYLVGLRVDLPLAALAVYWAAFVGFLGIWKGSSVTLYDERHEAMQARAAERTLHVAGAALILVGPALPAILAAGYEVPTVVLGALFGYAGLFGVFVVFYLSAVYWPS